MKNLFYLSVALASFHSYAQSTFQNFEGKYKIVKYLNGAPKCITRRTVFPCLKIGDIVEINSTADDASVKFLTTNIEMKSYAYGEDGHYSYAYFNGDGVEVAGWGQSSNEGSGRWVSISKFLPEYFQIVLEPKWHSYDDTRYEFAVKKVKEF